MKKTMAPIHPGEVLLYEFLAPLGVTQHRVAVSIGVPSRRSKWPETSLRNRLPLRPRRLSNRVLPAR